MHRRWITACAILITSCWTSVQAQQSGELLLPLDQKTVSKLERKSNFDLREQLYPSKRYRFVKVNFELLAEENASFTVTPFPDLQFEVTAKDVASPGSTEGYRLWRGEIVNTGMTDTNGIPVLVPIGLVIRSGEQEVPVKLIRELAEERGDKRTLAALPSSDTPERSEFRGKLSTIMNLQTVSGDLYMFSRGAHVLVEPIADDPRYHVVYEEDESKVVSGSHDQSPEAASKFKRYKTFRDQLEKERKEAAGE